MTMLFWSSFFFHFIKLLAHSVLRKIRKRESLRKKEAFKSPI